jgi:hypothetical protein
MALVASFHVVSIYLFCHQAILFNLAVAKRNK